MHERRSRPAAIVKGLLALAGMAAILIAIPVGLWVFGGNPIPSSAPSPDEVLRLLTSDTEGVLFLGTLRLLGWVGWLSLALPLLIDIVASVLRLPKPSLPGLSWQQGRAAALTGAVAAMMTFGGAGMASAATTAPAPVPAATATTTAATLTDTPAPATAQAPRQVVVQRGDTLSKIAKHELGRADRYPELFEASRTIAQPDGRHLSDPSVIYPGDRIVIPTAAPTHTAPVPAPPTTPAPQSTGHAPALTPAMPAPATPTVAAPEPTATQPAAPALSDPAPATTTAPSTTADQAPTEVAPAATDSPAVDQDDDTARHVATAAGLGSLAAAGLLLALRRRRDARGRHRAPGTRTPTPAPALAAVERDLRAVADPLTTTHLDLALRSLAMHARHLGTPMPDLRAARISHDTLELYLTEDQTQLPTPFTSAPDDPGTWTLHRSHLDALADAIDADTIPAPYPALVSLGVDEGDAHLLLNLEELGSLALSGDPTDCHEVLTALAIELLTAPWADDSRITLVGVLPELAHALGSDRASYCDQVNDITTSLTYTADITRQALADAGLTGPTTARLNDDGADAWSPHLLIIGTDLSASERADLQRVLQTVPRVAVAAVTTGSSPLGEWGMDINRHDGELTAVIAPAEISLAPQHLPLDAYRAHLALFEDIEHPDVPGPDWAQTLSSPLPTDEIPEQSADFPLDGDPEDDDLQARAAAQFAGMRGALPLFPFPTHLPESFTATPTQRTTDVGRPLPTPEPAAPTAPPTADDAQHAEEPTPTRQPAPEPLTAEMPDAHATPALAEEDPGVLESSLPVGVEEQDVVEVPTLPEDAPVVRLLGPVAILNAPGTKPRSPARIAELVAYLALHPGRSVEAFNAAIFPGERADGGRLGEKRNGYMRQARTFMGTNAQGHPYVGVVPAIGYALDPSTAVDWWLFRDLVGSDISRTGTVMLEAALRLVDGQPLSGVDPSRYLWAMSDQGEMIAAIADVAHELATRALDAGDSRTADWAASKGLLVEPVSEALWRVKISAAYQSGNPDKLTRTIEQMHAHLDPVTGDLEDETQALLSTVLTRQPLHV